jgi:hypothetical protein
MTKSKATQVRPLSTKPITRPKEATDLLTTPALNPKLKPDPPKLSRPAESPVRNPPRLEKIRDPSVGRRQTTAHNLATSFEDNSLKEPIDSITTLEPTVKDPKDLKESKPIKLDPKRASSTATDFRPRATSSALTKPLVHSNSKKLIMNGENKVKAELESKESREPKE